MTRAAAIREYLDAHPDADDVEIAAELGCTPAAVRMWRADERRSERMRGYKKGEAKKLPLADYAPLVRGKGPRREDGQRYAACLNVAAHAPVALTCPKDCGSYVAPLEDARRREMERMASGRRGTVT